MNTIMKDKISSQQKRDLKILVESFLERDKSSIAGDSRVLFEQLYWILMKNILPDEYSHVSDMTDDELKTAMLQWYRLLTPLWKKFKKAVFDFRENIFPEREKLESADKALNPSSPLSVYEDLQGYGYIPRDKFYPITLTNIPKVVNLTFDKGRVNIFRKELNAISSFIDLVQDAPVDLFARCGHCRKVIIISRKGKRYHTGCAAKAIQKEFWRKNKKTAREKEKLRYAEKRKQKRLLKKEREDVKEQ